MNPRNILLLTLCLLSAPLYASFLEAELLGDIAFAAWDGDGGRTIERELCIAAAENARPAPPPNGGDATSSYRVKIDDLSSQNTFTLFRNGDLSQSYSGRLQVEISHSDLFHGASLHELFPGFFETATHNGQYRTCASGRNAVFKFEITDNELDGKQAGTYEGDFALTIEAGNGASLAIQNFSITIALAGQDEVRVSGLDDVSFGAANSLAALSKTELFCLYSSSGAYRLSITSPDQSADGQVQLRHTLSSALIPVSTTFDDGISSTPLLTNLAVSGTSTVLQPDCNGSNNSSLTFEISAESLQTAPSGLYQQTITLLVEPE